MIDNFIIFRSTLDAFKAFPAEAVGKAIIMIGDYAMDGKEPETKAGLEYGIFLSVKPVIDGRKKKSDAGKAGVEAKSKQTPSKPQANPEHAPSNTPKTEDARGMLEGCCEDAPSKPQANPEQNQQKEKEKINNNINTKERKKKEKSERFTPPSVEEVSEYVAKMGYSFDPESFVAFYASKGWMVGKSKMRDWKQACVTWENRRKEERATKPQAVKKNRFTDFQQRDYDMDELEKTLLGYGG